MLHYLCFFFSAENSLLVVKYKVMQIPAAEPKGGGDVK